MTENLELLDAVELTQDIPEHKLKAHVLGTIVDLLDGSGEFYEVEFTDEQGKTIFQGALRADLIKPHKST